MLMRIGMNATALTPARARSGLGRYVYELIAAMSRQLEDDDRLVLFSYARSLSELLEGRIATDAAIAHERIETVRVPRSRFTNRSRGIWHYWTLPRALRRHRPPLDIFHDPNQLGPFLRRAPYAAVVTVHDLMPLEAPSSEPPGTGSVIKHRLLLPKILARSQRIIVPSAYTKDAILARFDLEDEDEDEEERIAVIHHGCAASFHPLDRDEARSRLEELDLPSRYILTTAHRPERRNITPLLVALQALWYDDKKIPLVVLQPPGMPPSIFLEPAIRSAGPLPIPTVREVSDLSDDTLVALYSLATAFVFISAREGFGLPPIEAMACGTPVIAQRAGAVPEVVGDAALLCDNTPEELLDALRSLLEDRHLRRRLRENGIKRAAGFSWEKAAADTLDVYRAAVRAKTENG